MASLLVCAQPATGHPEPFVSKPGADAVRLGPIAPGPIVPGSIASEPIAPIIGLVPSRLGPTALIQHLGAVPRLSRITLASRLEVRPFPDRVTTGIDEMDTLTGGLPRSCLTEIYGPACSGHTTILMSALAAATRRGEACALVDVSDAFDPQSASVAGMNFKNLLWIRCGANDPGQRRRRENFSALSPRSSQPKQAISQSEGVGQNSRVRFNDDRKAEWVRLEQALKTIDLLLQSGGFGMVVIDLNDVPTQFSRRIPLTSWFRFRRAVENTSTVLLVLGRIPCARTCASLLLRLEEQAAVMTRPSTVSSQTSDSVSHAQLFEGSRLQVELQRSRLERKPVQPDHCTFVSKNAWVG
jgi:hypothetical protein